MRGDLRCRLHAHLHCRLHAQLMCLLAVVLAMPTAADAEAGFAWRAPESCPDADAVRARIATRLARESTVTDGGDGTELHVGAIEVSVEKVAKGFVATIDARAITVANDVRTLTSERCDALADAVALIVVRLANEAAREARVVTPPAATRTRSPVAKTSAIVESDMENTRKVVVERRAEPVDATPLWGGGLHAIGLSGIGAQPGVAVGAEVGVHVRRRDTMFELAYARWAAKPVYIVDGAPGRVDVSLASLALRVGWGPERLPIRGWAYAEVGSMVGEGVALFDNRMGDSRWTAVGAGFGVGWPIARMVRLVGSLEIGAAVDRPRFVVGATEIHRPYPATARTALGFEVGWR
jgi:hypothetical protein